MDVCEYQDRAWRFQVQYRIPDREPGNFCTVHCRTSGEPGWKAYGRNDHGLLPPRQIKG